MSDERPKEVEQKVDYGPEEPRQTKADIQIEFLKQLYQTGCLTEKGKELLINSTVFRQVE